MHLLDYIVSALITNRAYQLDCFGKSITREDYYIEPLSGRDYDVFE